MPLDLGNGLAGAFPSDLGSDFGNAVCEQTRREGAKFSHH
ncbi:hypothetical protein [Azospirillum argentinense]